MLPTPKQPTKIIQTIGVYRYFYNQYLEHNFKLYRVAMISTSMSIMSCQRNFPGLKNVVVKPEKKRF
jgi:hypothetical protein